MSISERKNDDKEEENPIEFITENPILKGMGYVFLIALFMVILDFDPNEKSDVDNYIRQNALNETVIKIAQDSLNIIDLDNEMDSLIESKKIEIKNHELIITKNLQMQDSIKNLKKEIYDEIDRNRKRIYKNIL